MLKRIVVRTCATLIGMLTVKLTTHALDNATDYQGIVVFYLLYLIMATHEFVGTYPKS